MFRLMMKVKAHHFNIKLKGCCVKCLDIFSLVLGLNDGYNI